MSVVIYDSTDSGAPVLTGQAGSFVNLCDTLLDGVGTAYGSKPKAGWTKVFSGANKGVYRTADGVGYYRVQHDGAQGAASTRELVVRGAEGATDVDTLVDAYPTVAQVADALCVWRVSGDTTATARPWIAMATPNFFQILVSWGAVGSSGDWYKMGKFFRRGSAYAHSYLVNTRNVANSTAASVAASTSANFMENSYNNKLWAMRDYSGAVKSVQAALLTRGAGGAGVTPGRSGPPMPDSNGEILREPSTILLNARGTTASSSPTIGGYLPNTWWPLHGSYGSAARLDVFGDLAYNAAAQFLLVSQPIGGVGLHLVWETTDTWDPYG